MKNSNLLTLFLLCIFTNVINAQVVTLDSVLSRIENNNPMLKMYDEQINAINYYSQMTKSWMPPTFSTGLWQTPYNDFRSGMWMFTGEQMIPNPARQKSNFNYMKGMIPVETAEKGAQVNELFTMAKNNYYEWIVLKLKYDVLLQTDSLLNYIIEVAKFRYAYNKEKLNSIYKAQADLFELQNMETMMLSDMRMKNIELNVLMNNNREAVFDIDTTLEITNYELQFPDTSQILNARSDIRGFDAKINQLRLQQKFEKAKRLPDFGISLSHMQSLGVMENQYAAMGMIAIPIAPWSSKEYKSNISGLDYSANAISYQKQALTNETAGMIATLQSQIASAKKQLDNYRMNINPTYFKSYQASLIGYEENTVDLFVVLDGLKMFRMTKMNELEQLNSLLKLQVAYEKELEIR